MVVLRLILPLPVKVQSWESPSVEKNEFSLLFHIVGKTLCIAFKPVVPKLGVNYPPG